MNDPTYFTTQPDILTHDLYRALCGTLSNLSANLRFRMETGEEIRNVKLARDEWLLLVDAFRPYKGANGKEV